MTHATRDGDLARAQSVDAFLSLMQTLVALSSEEKPWLDLDVTMTQLKALIIVVQTGGVPSRGLAERLSIGPSAVTPLVDQLVDQKLVRREDDATDRRVVLIRPTPRAIALRRKLLEAKRAVIAEVFDGVPPADVPGVQRALAQLLEAAARLVARTEAHAR